MPLADTLLRLAEEPSLYRPRWSDEIIDEMTRNLSIKLGLSRERALRREAQMRAYFPESLVSGYEHLVPEMHNQLKDRHVLAAAVHCGAHSIVTFNERDFTADALAAFGMKREAPSAFLSRMYDAAPLEVKRKLEEQADSTDRDLDRLLQDLNVNVPSFVRHFRRQEDL
jgi:hypothetical protein